MGTLSVEKQEKLEKDAEKAERKAEKKAEQEAKKKEVRCVASYVAVSGRAGLLDAKSESCAAYMVCQRPQEDGVS
jgi:hypothetical protein